MVIIVAVISDRSNFQLKDLHSREMLTNFFVAENWNRPVMDSEQMGTT